MTALTISDVLRHLDEDSDSDFDGYIDEDDYCDGIDDDEEEQQSEEPSNPPLSISTASFSTSPLSTPPLSIPPIFTPPLFTPPLFTPPLSIPPLSTPFLSTPFLSTPPLSTPPSIPDYQERSGCTAEMADKTPVDFFHLLVTDVMLESIVGQTNTFAEQYLEKTNVSPKSRANLWDNTVHDLAELKKFLSLVIVMGLIHFPAIEDYWITSWPFANTTFSPVLKRDRFTLLLRFLHLNNNANYIPKGHPGHDPLFKIRPFMEALINNFQKAYVPGREISLDESMIGFKGRLGFAQYMPKKPIKWGLKAFVVADSVSGYTFNWRLYTGKCIKVKLIVLIVYIIPFRKR